MIVVLGLSGVFAFIKANNVSASNAQLYEQVDAMTKKLETLTAVSVDERKRILILLSLFRFYES